VLAIEECLLIAENNTGHMAGTTTRRRPLVTTKRTMISEILKGLKDLKFLLEKTNDVKSDDIELYSDTIKTFSVGGIRATDTELARLSGILKTVKRWTNDSDVQVLADYLLDLIITTQRQFKYEEQDI
jgi:hypothetical protein